MACRHEKLHSLVEMWVEGLLALKANVAQGDDCDGLDFSVEMFLLQDCVYQSHASIEVGNEVVLEISREVLQNASGQALAHRIKLRLSVANRLLDQLHDCLCDLLDLVNRQGVEQAVDNQKGAATPCSTLLAYLLQAGKNSVPETVSLQSTLESDDEDLQQSTDVVHHDLLLCWSVSARIALTQDDLIELVDDRGAELEQLIKKALVIAVLDHVIERVHDGAEVT